jgi:hypothetical protein
MSHSECRVNLVTAAEPPETPAVDHHEKFAKELLRMQCKIEAEKFDGCATTKWSKL